MDYIAYKSTDELYHHGIKGQRWGFRRWQNEDGSLTEAGRRHYDVQDRRSDASVKVAKEQTKQAKIQAKMYQKAQKAQQKADTKAQKVQAKEDRKNLKTQKQIEKYQAERMKLELKQMKQEIAYQKGKKFGENFLPAFASNLGASFGRTAGEGLGRIANPLEWKKAKNDRIQAQADKMRAETDKMNKKLERDKYDEGFYERELANKEKQTENQKFSNETARIDAGTNRIKALEEQRQRSFDLSEEGLKRSAQKLRNESLEQERKNKKTDYDVSEEGHALNMENARAQREKAVSAGKEAEAKILGSKAGIIKAEAEKIRAETDSAHKGKELELQDRREKAQQDLDKYNAEGQRAKDNLKEITDRQQFEFEQKKWAYGEAKKQNQQDADNAFRTLQEKNKNDREMAKMANEATLKYNKQNIDYQLSKQLIDSREETRRSIMAELPRARSILQNPNASPASREAARATISRANGFDAYSDLIGDALRIQIPAIEVTSVMPSNYERNNIHR